MAHDDKQYMREPESEAELLKLLPAEQQAEYRNFKNRVLESAFPGRVLVVYTLVGGKPTNVEYLTFGHFRASSVAGPSTEVVSDKRPETLAVGVIPTKLPGRDVFLHIPQSFELKWKAKASLDGGVHFAAHYAVMVKVPTKRFEEGATHCVRLNTFWETFPEHSAR